MQFWRIEKSRYISWNALLIIKVEQHFKLSFFFPWRTTNNVSTSGKIKREKLKSFLLFKCAALFISTLIISLSFFPLLHDLCIDNLNSKLSIFIFHFWFFFLFLFIYVNPLLICGLPKHISVAKINEKNKKTLECK